MGTPPRKTPRGTPSLSGCSTLKRSDRLRADPTPAGRWGRTGARSPARCPTAPRFFLRTRPRSVPGPGQAREAEEGKEDVLDVQADQDQGAGDPNQQPDPVAAVDGRPPAGQGGTRRRRGGGEGARNRRLLDRGPGSLGGDGHGESLGAGSDSRDCRRFSNG